MNSIEWARSLAYEMLAPHLPDRWLHVQGVANRALNVSKAIPEIDADVLVQAAWLHDIGYSPEVAACGFHPIDGAAFLEARGARDDVVALVANHSGAQIEAKLRGIYHSPIYPDEPTVTRDALWYCDATTGPLGQRWKAEERWTEVRKRYGPGHIVTSFLDEAEPILRAAVERTTGRLSVGRRQT